MSPVSTWDVVAALGSAAGAVAGAVAAGAAWRAALASERTSAEAREALSAAIAPNVMFEPVQLPSDPDGPFPHGMQMMARIINLSRWAATDLEIVATFPDHEPVRERRDRLVTFGSPPPDSEIDDWWVPLRDVTETWPSRDEPDSLSVLIRYSDERGVSRYEREYRIRLSANASHSELLRERQLR